MGVLAANGNSLDTFWSSLCSCKSGIGQVTLFDTEGLRTTIAGEVKGFDPHEFIDASMKPEKRMSRAAMFGVAVARTALADAHLEISELQRMGEVPVFMGVSTSSMDLCGKAPRPWTGVEAIPHAVGSSVTFHLGFNSRLMTVSNGCASGLDAVAAAAAEVRSGRSDVVVAGAADSAVTRYVFEAFSLARRLATRNEDPEHACKPFDRDRDGGVIAEGAGILIIENLDHARSRGVKPYAEITAYATCADEADGEECSGLGKAMEGALINASQRPEQVDCIFAHGPGDRQTDAAETAQIHRVFGPHAYRIPVVSIKGATGSAMAVGGVHQTIAAALSIREKRVPPTTNFQNPCEECDLDYVPRLSRRLALGRVMVNTHGFGRGNSALILNRLVAA
jgi:3-oxoacyl-[acyl-carrier-protein] synthase II